MEDHSISHNSLVILLVAEVIPGAVIFFLIDIGSFSKGLRSKTRSTGQRTTPKTNSSKTGRSIASIQLESTTNTKNSSLAPTGLTAVQSEESSSSDLENERVETNSSSQTGTTSGNRKLGPPAEGSDSASETSSVLGSSEGSVTSGLQSS